MSLTEPVSRRPANRAENEELRVSSLELFFDLVFVFTLTQLTLAGHACRLHPTSIVSLRRATSVSSS
jgi:hypothetical protein